MNCGWLPASLLLLLVLVWATGSEPRLLGPLLADPPRIREVVLVHIAGLVIGVVLMLV